MKKFKKLICTLTSAIFLCSLSIGVITASAADNWKLTDTEISSTKQAIDEYNSRMIGGTAYSNSDENIQDSDMQTGKYDLNNAYKSYDIENLMISEYDKNNDFKSLFTDSRIIVPAETKTIDVTIADNKYEVAGLSENNGQTVNYIAEAESVLQQFDENIKDVYFATSYFYYMDFIFIDADSGQYVIPFNNSTFDNEYILSGCIYKLSDFMTVMKRTYDEEHFDGMSDGGVSIKSTAIIASADEFKPFDSTHNNKTGLILIASILLSMCVLAVASIIYFKHSKAHHAFV